MMYRTPSYAANTFDVFWYEKNLQGDIIAVYNSAGTKVATYTYSDAWGNHSVSYTNGGDSTGAIYNPFRYRSYYYDSDLGMYYLQSRYYDAKICRFISLDHVSIINATPTALTDKNLFAYCDNNPVSRLDKSGYFWTGIVIGAIVGATAGIVGQFISDMVTSALNGEFTISNWQTYTGAAVGGAFGGIVLAVTKDINIANFVTGAITTGVGQSLEKLTISEYNKSWAEIGANALIDGAISFGLGKLPGIKGATAGRNSWSAVYKSGLTKLRNGTVARMSAKVFAKE